MSKLEQLIAELCPDGVEHKTLGEIATDMYRGAGIKREEVTETGNPCVRYGEIYTTYGIWFEKCVSRTQSGVKSFGYGDILFAITGESVEEIAKSCAYIGNEKCYAGGDIVVMKHEQDPKYLAYALSTVTAQEQKSKGRVKSKVVHSSVPALQAICIPLPPLPVQSEIVRILDNFAELTAKLTAELAAELTARKKQYEYYRDYLLTFEKPATQSLTDRQRVRWVTLGEVCMTTSNIKWKETARPYRYIDLTSVCRDTHAITDVTIVNADNAPSRAQKMVEANDVIFATTRPTLQRFTLIGDDYAGEVASTGYCVLRADKTSAMPKWVYYCISTTDFNDYVEKNQEGSAYPAISDSKVKAFEIPLPSLEEQARIVAVLDKFDALTTDITAGLPAEIAARQKQYEYYRDKLLTFKEKVA